MKTADQIEYINTHLEKPIVIIGMMGAGKTTLARRLSEMLRWDFVDSDLEIENEQSLSIREMFEARGEAFFRHLEKEKISQLLDIQKRVVSVGGGSITSPETATNIFSKSLCLWIDAPISVLAKRVGSQGNRPLLNGRDAAEALTERMEQRQHLYEQAHLKVNGALPVAEVAKNALGQICEYLVSN